MATRSTSSSVTLLLAALQHLSRRNVELQQTNSQLAAKLAIHEQTEATLRKNEERFQLLAQASSDVLDDWDLQANVAWSSDGFQRLLGPTPPCGDMNWWWERIHPDDRQRLQDDFPLLLESSRAVMTLDCRLRCQDGTYADIVNHWRIWRDADGTALRVVGTITNISEHKQAERALRASEQNVRRFQEQLRRLHEIGIQLDSADSPDELCRMAVELGRGYLGFDRLGIWLYVDNGRIAQGTFGTDEQGQTRDERGLRIPANEYGIKVDELQPHPAGEVCGPIMPLLRGEQHIILQDPANILATSCDAILGTGWSAQAAMWNGKRPVGHISADNLIHQRPLAPYQIDLLPLYGTTLGHLYTRKQAERALRASEQNAQRFQEQLRTLHEIGIELDSADSPDELCRMAVELGRSRLGFDRLGIWLYEDDNRFLQGTFGSDEYGQTLDERNFRLPAARHKGAAWVLTAFERWQQSNSSEPFNLITPIIVHQRDSTWPEATDGPAKTGYVPGSGWTAQAAMWDGKRPVGHISSDNLIHQRPVAPYQMDLLALYGVTLGHLYTRKQAERAVRDSEAHLRAVLDSAPIIVFAANRQGTLTLNAGQALSQIGVRPGQNVGQSALDHFGTLTILESPDRIASVEDVFARVLGGETVAGIGQFGQSIFDAHYTPLLDEHGQVQGLVGVAIDITERKRAEEALRLSEKRYSVISGLSSDYAFSCIVLPDGTLKTEWVTEDAYTRITGYHSTEIGTAFTLYHPDDASLAEQHVRQVLAGQYVEGEYRIITKSGERKSVRIIREPEWDETHQRVVRYYGAVEDITERKRSEEALRQREAAQKAAEEANRVKSLFLANMSHELRTPLNAILNFTAFVADGVFGPINDEQADALRQSVSSAKHLLSLINDILDLTKIEVGLMDLFIQQVDVNQVLEVSVSLAKGLVKGKPLELVTSIDLGLPTIFGDERRIRQIFLNLISNAVKFTPRGTIGIAARREQDAIHVAVSDTGIGIAPEDQALVFESFKQAQSDLPETVGTGLGLAISRFFAEAHGGTIWLESEVGKGSTFHVALPIRTEAQARQRRPQVRPTGAV